MANPAKFAGVLPVLWHEDDDTIYEVPAPSSSLARVIPGDAVVKRAPLHGLDLEPARQYVAALDDESYPEAKLVWISPDRGRISAQLKSHEVISLQITHDPGWRAFINKSPRKISKDGLGLMIIQPDCSGSCTIELAYRATAEIWSCRILSAGMVFGFCLLTSWRYMRYPHPNPLTTASASS